MPVYPKAVWRPIQGHTDGPMRSHTGAVLHVNESNGNLFGWVSGNHDVSCHFEVYKNGSIEQYLDTAMTSWCQMDGNADYISIETEGFHTEPLTAAQVAAIALLMAWLHVTHDIELELAEKPGDKGFGWHGMGGAAWGGHTSCPGDQRRAQRHEILVRARAIVAGQAGKPAQHPARGPVPQTPIDSRPANQYHFQLFTAAGDRKHRVYAVAPGQFVEVGAGDINALIRYGLSSRLIHRVTAGNLARLHRISTGSK